MNKFKFAFLILLPIIFLLFGTVSSSSNSITVNSNTNSTKRIYTKFNVTATVNESYVCDVTYQLPKPVDGSQNECSFECNKYYYRIEEYPGNVNRFYFCPTKALACRTNSSYPFPPLDNCWTVTCFSGNRSVKVDATYTVLCVDPNPPPAIINSTESNNSISLNNLISLKLLVMITFVILIFIL